MFLTVLRSGGTPLTLELTSDFEVFVVKVLIQDELGIEDFKLSYKTKLLEEGTLIANGIESDTSINLLLPSDMAHYTELIQNVTQHGQLPILKQNDPDLAQAITENDPYKLKGIMDERVRVKNEKEEEKNKLIRLAQENPMDLEVQRKIQEQIDEENIYNNLNHAMEHNPEAFSSVHMLYIHATINGHKLKAFVDSGAQMTILSEKCAKECNVFRLADKRWQGTAQGVGTTKILGRIHAVPVTIGNAHLPCSFSVLENQSVDFILGLDMLKRHQCCIDLEKNVLRIGTTGEEVPFLSEGEIPNNAFKQNSEMTSTQLEKTASSATASNSQSHGHNEDTIKSLMEMGGLSRDQVVAALDLYNGDGDSAAAHLFG